MRENRTMIWLFSLSFGLLLLFFFSTEQIDNHQLGITRLAYTRTSRGVDINALFDRASLEDYLSGMFSDPEMRLSRYKEDIVYHFTDESLLDTQHLDPAEPRWEIKAFYEAYLDYYDLVASGIIKTRDDLTYDVTRDRMAVEAYESMRRLVSNDTYMGTFDIYTIGDETNYDVVLNIQIYADPDKSYNVIAASEKVYVDLDQNMSLDYGYYEEEDLFKQILLINKDQFIQTVYENVMMFLKDGRRYDFNYNGQQVIILKLEDK